MIREPRDCCDSGHGFAGAQAIKRRSDAESQAVARNRLSYLGGEHPAEMMRRYREHRGELDEG